MCAVSYRVPLNRRCGGVVVVVVGLCAVALVVEAPPVDRCSCANIFR